LTRSDKWKGYRLTVVADESDTFTPRFTWNNQCKTSTYSFIVCGSSLKPLMGIGLLQTAVVTEANYYVSSALMHQTMQHPDTNIQIGINI